MKNKSSIERNAESALAAKLSADAAQHRLDQEFLEKVIRIERSSIFQRMATLLSRGKPASAQDAIDSLINTEKGPGFEAIVAARHAGRSPFNWAFVSLKDGSGLSQNQPGADIKVYARDLFGRGVQSQTYELKSSFEEAKDAIFRKAYGVPVVVPDDVFDKLSRMDDTRIRAAIQNGSVLKSAGASGKVTSAEVIQKTKERLKAIHNGRAGEDFYGSLKAELQSAFTIGAVLRGTATTVSLAVSHKKLTFGHARTIAIETTKGGLQTAARVGLARGLEKFAIDKGVRGGGRWLGRSAGAVAGFLISTAVDGALLLHPDKACRITPRQFGLRFSKNSIVAVATCISGPLGLGVSLSLTIGEVIHSKNLENDRVAKAATKESVMLEHQMQKQLVNIKHSFVRQNQSIARIESQAQSAKELILERKKHG